MFNAYSCYHFIIEFSRVIKIENSESCTKVVRNHSFSMTLLTESSYEKIDYLVAFYLSIYIVMEKLVSRSRCQGRCHILMMALSSYP